MICISIAGTKGGIGKTTTAVALGQLFAQQVGETVIADLDLQASATAWSLEAKESGKPFDSDVRQLSPALSAARLPRSTISEIEHADVAIIDTPPGVIERIDAAIEVTAALGGLTIVTTSPSALDLPRAASTIELIDDRTPVVVLLTRVRARTVSAREARQELVDYGAHVLENEIPLLEAIAGAGKTAPQPNSVLLDKYEPVAEELLDVLEKVGKQ